MKTRLRKPWAVVAGLALFASTASGVAYAAGSAFAGNPDSLAWYSADETAVTVNPDKTATALTFYDAAGSPVTTGSVSAKPFVAYAAAGDPLRAGDDHATLFAHTANPGLAQGAWTGAQLTAANQFPVAGAPAGVGSDPVVKGSATSLSLADYIAGYENTSTASGFADVYEIRLRSSSAEGVGTAYASTYVKVTGDTWTVTSSPVNLVSTSTTPSVPASARYGTAFKVSAAVTATDASVPAGTVSVLKGATVLGTGTLAAGRATITIAGTRLAPGGHALVLRYNGSASLAPSSAAARTVAIAKALSTTSSKIVKTPLKRSRVPQVVVTVRAAGIAKPTGTIRIYSGAKVLKTVTLTAATNGRIVIKLPKFKKAKRYTLVARYAGSGTVGASNARGVVIKIT